MSYVSESFAVTDVCGAGDAFAFVIASLLVMGVYVAICVPRFLNVTVTGGPATAEFMWDIVIAKAAIKDLEIFMGVAPCGVVIAFHLKSCAHHKL